jgi:hypothetical protein
MIPIHNTPKMSEKLHKPQKFNEIIRIFLSGSWDKNDPKLHMIMIDQQGA